MSSDAKIYSACCPARNELQTARIVDYLITTLGIPEGDQLVSFFGVGTEPSNREAMMTWISALSHEYDADETEYRLARLVLHAHLETSETKECV